MESYEIFKNACVMRGRTIADVCKKAGWGERSSDNWKKGHIPSVAVVLALSKELKTTVEYLMGETNDIDAKVSNGLEGLSDSEIELLTVFRSLNQDGQGKVIENAADLLGNVKYKKDESSVKTA